MVVFVSWDAVTFRESINTNYIDFTILECKKINKINNTVPRISDLCYLLLYWYNKNFVDIMCTRPFPSLRVGSGNKTSAFWGLFLNTVVSNESDSHHVAYNYM